ncbi:MAG: hypothetical protein AB1Z22_12905 [Synechococcaceae cyanobacterium]
MPSLFAALLLGLFLSTGPAQAHCERQGGHQHSDSGSPVQR